MSRIGIREKVLTGYGEMSEKCADLANRFREPVLQSQAVYRHTHPAKAAGGADTLAEASAGAAYRGLGEW